MPADLKLEWNITALSTRPWQPKILISAAWWGYTSTIYACRRFMKRRTTQRSVTESICRALYPTAGRITQNVPPAPRYHQRRRNLPPAHSQPPRPRPAWCRIHPIPNLHKTKFRHGLLQCTQFSAPKSQMVHSPLICALSRTRSSRRPRACPGCIATCLATDQVWCGCTMARAFKKRE